MHAEAMRSLLFTMKMSAEERRLADKVAEHHGLTVASLVRYLLKKEEREIAVSRPAKKGAGR